MDFVSSDAGGTTVGCLGSNKLPCEGPSASHAKGRHDFGMVGTSSKPSFPRPGSFYEAKHLQGLPHPGGREQGEDRTDLSRGREPLGIRGNRLRGAVVDGARWVSGDSWEDPRP